MQRQTPTSSILELAAGLLSCPQDGPGLARVGNALQCSKCPFRLVADEGLLLDREGEAPQPAATGALKLMESPLVVRIYERLWRPALIRVVSPLRYADEDALVDRYLQPREGLRMLDLCCGTARASRRWLLRRAEVLGIDQSIAMLREARRLWSENRLVLVRGDAARRLPMPGTFDAAICFASLHLLRAPRAVIETAAAALRPGGLFFTWVVVSTGLLASANLRRLITGPVGLRVFSPGGLCSEVTATGLDVVEVFTKGAIEFVVARRR